MSVRSSVGALPVY